MGLVSTEDLWSWSLPAFEFVLSRLLLKLRASVGSIADSVPFQIPNSWLQDAAPRRPIAIPDVQRAELAPCQIRPLETRAGAGSTLWGKTVVHQSQASSTGSVFAWDRFVKVITPQFGPMKPLSPAPERSEKPATPGY